MLLNDLCNMQNQRRFYRYMRTLPRTQDNMILKQALNKLLPVTCTFSALLLQFSCVSFYLFFFDLYIISIPDDMEIVSVVLRCPTLHSWWKYKVPPVVNCARDS